jgi:predicted GIY-YIG superfamily endonuclease
MKNIQQTRRKAKSADSRTVYLLHFDAPYQHARHYVGFTDNLENRLAEHRKGNGARLIQVITGVGIGFVLARTWQGDRNFERQLKKRRCAPRYCPICRKEKSNEKKI